MEGSSLKVVPVVIVVVVVVVVDDVTNTGKVEGGNILLPKSLLPKSKEVIFTHLYKSHLFGCI